MTTVASGSVSGQGVRLSRGPAFCLFGYDFSLSKIKIISWREDYEHKFNKIRLADFIRLMLNISSRIILLNFI